MVKVAKQPHQEAEPILDAADNSYIERRNSCAEEAYKTITSSMRADPLQIKSPKTALELLSTAAKLQNMPLVKQCIDNLDQQLDKYNVLTIYSHLSKCKMPSTNKNEFEPSAPPIIENENQRDTDWVQELTEGLRHNCLLEIDKNADFILKQKEILDLSYPDILNIVERDTLETSSELLVYSAIYRWSIAECHRRTLQTHLLNVKAVLRQLCYAPRYGLMSKREFTSRTVDGVKGPVRSEILEEKEWRRIKFYIEEKSKKRPVEELPYKASQPRISGSEKPKLLSCRSSSTQPMGHISSNRDANCRNRSAWEKCLINFLTCWTAIFD